MKVNRGVRIRFDANGERANERVITLQFRGVKNKDLEQFKNPDLI